MTRPAWLSVTHLPPWLRGIVSFARAALDEYNANNGPLIAAAMSFFILLSVVPLLVAGVAVFGYVVRGGRAEEMVLGFAQQYVPGLNDEVRNILAGLAAKSGSLGLIGLLGLLWTGSQVFLNVEAAMNLVWGVREARSFFASRGLALLMTVLSGLPLLASVVITAGLGAAHNLATQVPGIGRTLLDYAPFWAFLGSLVPLLLTLASFTVLFRLMPRTHVHWRAALLGALFTTFVWEAAKRAFSFYLARYADFESLYGNLGSAVAIVTWVYYSSFILLLGVAVTHQAQCRLTVSGVARRHAKRRHRAPAV
jgi:membrane protein